MAMVTYHLPNSAEIVQLNGAISTIELSDLESAEGFVLNTFDNAERFLIQADNISVFPLSELKSLDLGQPILKHTSDFDALSKDQYSTKIQDFQSKMISRGIDKAIFSRKIQHLEKVDLTSTFRNMVTKYPGAFCYCLQSEETGTWMAATPEKLFNQLESGKIQVHSLAGTQPSSNINWSKKEYEEQEIVTDYISDLLTDNGFSDFITGKRETIVAGAVAHLRTTFTLSPKPESLTALVKLLHPTPAVCGTPKEKALELIKESEGYNRKFYAGFLGPLGKKLGNHLFVNLRCMEITETGADLYVGGGITAASIPEKEWEETELKSRTMLAVVC